MFGYHGRFAVLNICSQPSIQKLVGSLAQDAQVYLTEEAVHTDAYVEETPGVNNALMDLKEEFVPSSVDQAILIQAVKKINVRVTTRNKRYAETVGIRIALPNDDCYIFSNNRFHRSLTLPLGQQFMYGPIRCIDSLRSYGHEQWRYIQIAVKFLYGLLFRDHHPPPELASFFMQHSVSPHPTIRIVAQKYTIFR